MRIGIAAKLLSGLAVVAVVVAVAYWQGWLQMARVQGELRTVSSRHLPALVAAAELLHESEQLVALVPDILQSHGFFLERSVRQRADERFERARGLIDVLRRSGTAEHQLEPLTGLYRRMVANLKELVRLTGDRKRYRQREARIGRRLYRMGLEFGGQGSPWAAHPDPADTASSPRSRFSDLVITLQYVRRAEHGATLDRFQQYCRQGIGSLAAAIETGPPAWDAWAHPYLGELQGYIDGDEGNLFRLRRSELQLAEAIEANLQQGRFVANTILAKAIALFEQVRETVKARDRVTAGEMARLHRNWTITGIVSLLSLVWIYLYSRRSIIGRLLRLQQAMQANTERQPVPVPVEGNDEISAMATEANYFIDEIRSREERLHESLAELEEASRAKSDFLANMSHEIRTPINAIVGLTDLCLDTRLTRTQRDYLTRVEQSAENLLGLVNDILDLSKIEARRLELEWIPLSPRELLERVRTLMVEQARRKGLRLETAVMDRVPEAVTGDPLRLQQILINLVDNAVKFTGAGAVTVRIDRRDGDSPRGEGERVALRFTVRDTGIGIRPEKLQALFEAFTQADSSTTRHYGGTGLGLTICERLVTAMGGAMGVDSTPGRGSAFHFDLPLAVAAAGGPVALAREPGRQLALRLQEQLAQSRFLVVEDNDINRAVVTEQLRRIGVAVDHAVNGLEALERVGSTRYDCILMDLQMPEMDGYRAAEEIRRLDNGRDTTIVALSANAMNRDRVRALRAGMDALLAKPLRTAELYRGLAELLLPIDEAPVSQFGESGEPDEADPALSAGREDRERALMQRLQQQFLGRYAQAPAELRELWARGEHDALCALVHNLNGIVGLLDPGPLRDAAGELEDGLRGAQPATAAELAVQVEAVAGALERTLELIRSARSGTPPASPESAA